MRNFNVEQLEIVFAVFLIIKIKYQITQNKNDMFSFSFSSLIVNRFVVAAALAQISIRGRRWKILNSWFSFVYFIYLLRDREYCLRRDIRRFPAICFT